MSIINMLDNIREQTINKRFDIVLCELYNPAIHGFDSHSDPTVTGHYLTYCRFDSIAQPANENSERESDSDGTDNECFDEEDEEDEEIDPNIYDVAKFLKLTVQDEIIPFKDRAQHPFIRNYKSIIINEKYLKPEIAECVKLSGDECVAILKTFWLRIVQRTWKRVFAERKAMIELRRSPKALNYRERNGKWPLNCCRLPALKGMIRRPRKV
jgi:hypothetical protein